MKKQEFHRYEIRYHTVSLTKSKTLNERFTDIERDLILNIITKSVVKRLLIREKNIVCFCKHDCIADFSCLLYFNKVFKIYYLKIIDLHII